MFKPTKRKGFNFFRSYFDVYNELNYKDKVKFIDALFDRQFLGIKPENLKGMSSFAYISQTNSIDNQVKGYEDKARALNKDVPNFDPWQGSKNNDLTPTEQVQGEVKEKQQGEVKEKEEKGRFKPPTLQQIKNLIKERSFKINAETFFNHYEANGWKVGRNKMKDWKAAIAGWESRDKNGNNGNQINKGNNKPMAGKDRIATDFTDEC